MFNTRKDTLGEQLDQLSIGQLFSLFFKAVAAWIFVGLVNIVIGLTLIFGAVIAFYAALGVDFGPVISQLTQMLGGQ